MRWMEKTNSTLEKFDLGKRNESISGWMDGRWMDARFAPPVLFGRRCKEKAAGITMSPTPRDDMGDTKAYDDSIPIAVQAQESKRRKRRILKVSVYCMFGIIAMGVFVIWLFHKDSKESLRFGSMFLFTVKLRRLEIKSYEGDGVLYGDMGRRLLATPYDHCWHNDYKDYEENCLQWIDTAKLHVEQYVPGNDTSHGACYTLRWVGLSSKFVAEDCFYLQQYRWYGVLTNYTPVWPIENVHLEDLTDYYDEYPSVQDDNLVPIWYGSQGVAIFVDSGFHFSMGWNTTKKRQFCIRSKLSYDPKRPTRDLLRYTVCQASSIKDVYHLAQKHRKDLDTDFPPENEKHDLLRLPIRALAQERDLQELVGQLENNESTCSLFEIYDEWEKSYGDLVVNPDLLPKLEHVISVAERRPTGCHPILPVSTFFTYSSKLFQEGAEKRYFVRDQDNLVTRLVLWRNQEGAVLDVTNPDAAEWFLGHVVRLVRQLKVHALKLLHLNIPPDSSYHDENMTHLDYTRIFHRDLASLTAMNISLLVERASGFIPLPVYTPVRTMFYEKNGDKCFNTSVPYTLTMGLSGYPLLIADADLLTNPTTAMFMRWLQLAVFFPVMEIPNLPLLKNRTMQNFLREILELRLSELMPYLEKVWTKEPGLPILRPLLWDWPNDLEAQIVSDQFMVGDSLLVAPVLCERTTRRKVYLPAGKWVGHRNNQTVYKGGKFYKFSVEDFTLKVHALKLLHLNIPPDSSYHDENMTHLDYTRIFHRDLASLTAMNISLLVERASGFIPLPVYTPVRTMFYEKNGDKCFNTSVPYTLTMGLSGYPLLIADADLLTNPTTAMFMRWLQLAVFFPVMEIPNLPLLKNRTMQNFLREILELRLSELMPYLEKVWTKEPGLPILRPLLWDWPNDLEAQIVSDQFMVGDRLLVAPVLCERTTRRKVYLPAGKWVGHRNNQTVYKGGKFYKFSVEDFTVIPFFWRVG
ncbi:hypothetical protein EGW08_018097 [Elysia chlorotica]|uniref:Glycoside hydrolase family 31 N-terminal domain-containing protein n=1 Tax=Elysia chlorotica TaxID=188477 RepID=A0A433SXX9_ELYCH|nr:hypothetical protein EGW08_018097 [Elysia chlorotica]